MKQRPSIPLFLLLMAGLPALLSGEASPDRVEVAGGAVLTGIVESVEDGILWMNTAYAGRLAVDLTQVERIRSDRLIPGEVPVPVVTHVAKSPERKALAAKVAEEPSGGWALEAGLDLSASRGNTEKLDLTVTVDALLERDHDKFDLYGRYAYGDNRGRTTTNELILGTRYTNFFHDGLGVFIREELERDDFEGLVFRSTTASGLIWRLRQERDLAIEARSGLSYRYEDYADDGYEDFPGLDFGLDIRWRFTEWARFKGSYTFLPSADDFEDFILEQDSGFNVPLDTSDRWKLRFGISSKYNNNPDVGRERMDLRYYARLIATWN
ncbi:MAG: DUF481 domain-containing protein [Oceanipulchritudo sp.]